MSLVTRFSVFFLVALAVALGAFSGCLYYLLVCIIWLASSSDWRSTRPWRQGSTGFPAASCPSLTTPRCDGLSTVSRDNGWKTPRTTAIP